jgi:sulfur-oxidizing protein SoxZ
MGDPMRIRALARASGIEVRALIAHPMETGQRKDDAGAVIPAWYITDVEVRLNDRPVLKASWGTAISKDPLLVLHLRRGAAGDRIRISWVDNHGDRRSDEVAVVSAT